MPHVPFTWLSQCYFRPPPLTDSFTLFFGQEKADTAEGDAGRLRRRYLPGHCHHSHGDAQNPAAGCGANWYVVFSSLCTGQAEGKGLGLGYQGRGEGMNRENPFSSPCSPRSEVSQDVAEVSPLLPSSFSPTLTWLLFWFWMG